MRTAVTYSSGTTRSRFTKAAVRAMMCCCASVFASASVVAQTRPTTSAPGVESLDITIEEVGALVQFLCGKDRTAEHQRVALRAVSRIKVPKASRLLTQFIENPDPYTRDRAMVVLGSCNLTGVVGVLDKLLREEDQVVRGSAVVGLAGSSDIKASNSLLTALADTEPRVRRAAMLAFKSGRLPPEKEPCIDIMNGSSVLGKTALLEIGVKFDPALQTAIVALGVRDKDVAVRETALKINWWLNGRAEYVLEDVNAAAADKESRIRAAAAAALLTMEWQKPPEALMKLTEDKDFIVRANLAATLRTVKDRDVESIVEKLRHDPAIIVRLALVRSLAQAGIGNADEILVEATGDKDEGIRVAALMSLARKKSPQLQKVFPKVYAGLSASSKSDILHLVGVFPTTQSSIVLDEMVSAKEIGPRLSVLRALGKLSKDLQDRYVERLSSDADAGVRQGLIHMVAARGNDPKAAAILKRMAGDQNKAVALAAKTAIESKLSAAEREKIRVDERLAEAKSGKGVRVLAVGIESGGKALSEFVVEYVKAKAVAQMGYLPSESDVAAIGAFVSGDGGGASKELLLLADKPSERAMQAHGAKWNDLQPAEHMLAGRAAAIIVNPTSKLESLTLDQVRGIFAGETTDWSVLAGPKGPIHCL
ncbi:MAG: HEAT repeat domain-containing protein, partial [Planctomycetes bacterium]|nr:HEAT repeat domain-containing protein [Planctomycetota bacterium]